MAFTCRNFIWILKTKISFKRCAMKVCQQLELVKSERAGFSTNSSNAIQNMKMFDKRRNKSVICAGGNLKNYNANFQLMNSHFHNTYASQSNYEECLEASNQKNGVNDAENTYFGYEQIKESEKINKVYNVFENVATSYDLMNDAMSVGIHRLWKTVFVEQLNVKPGMKILDMAGGTGDIAFKILDNFVSRYPNMASVGKCPNVVISDINKNMLDVGKKRAKKIGIEQSFTWVEANAEDLPFEDESFDLYTIAFGIRNTTHIERVLEEAFRVLKIGGRLSCLEFSTVENPIISELYDNFSFQVIPIMGQVLANDWKSYQYLVESIRTFPTQEDFAEMIYDGGFSNVRFENLTFGVVAIHDAFKI